MNTLMFVFLLSIFFFALGFCAGILSYTWLEEKYPLPKDKK